MRLGSCFLLCILTLADRQAAANAPLPSIGFDPPGPAAGQFVTAMVPFQICAWNVVITGNRIDINWMPAPCAMQSFTNKVPLAALPSGSYSVYLNESAGQAPIEQAFGILGVGAPFAQLPALGWVGLLVCCAGIVLVARSARRRRIGIVRAPIRSQVDRSA